MATVGPSVERSVRRPTPESVPGGRRIRGLDAEQRRDQRRSQLLSAALEVIAANGYLNASIEQICQVAYVGTKGFYEIFDSREACYIALLGRIADDTGATVAAALEAAPSDARTAIPMLVGVFAHALVDDPRVASVTFGGSSGNSPAIEQQKRANRRWAATLVESIWDRYQLTAAPVSPAAPGTTGPADAAPAARHPLAIGVIGGMFDLIADWLLTAEPSRSADIEQLIVHLTAFFQMAHRGLPSAGSPAPG